MKERQKEYWKSAVSQMNDENQLELAKILVDELQENEKSFDEEDNYDFKTSGKLREILEKYIEIIEPVARIKQKAELFEKFFKLSKESQVKVLEELLPNIALYLKQEEDEKRLLECKINGHQFPVGEWIEEKYYDEKREHYDKILFNTFSYSSKKRSIYDYGVKESFQRKYGDGVFIQALKNSFNKVHYTTLVDENNITGDIYWLPYSTLWKKVCSNCGYTEISLNCPQELIDRKKEEERQERISQLKRELKILEKF